MVKKMIIDLKDYFNMTEKKEETKVEKTDMDKYVDFVTDNADKANGWWDKQTTKPNTVEKEKPKSDDDKR